MSLLAGGITHGQAIALVCLCIFSIIFIIVDVYFVLYLHRRNKKLARDKRLNDDEDNINDGKNINNRDT